MTTGATGKDDKLTTVYICTCTKEQAMVPLRSWLSNVSHMATSGTLVTPSVMMMIPESQSYTVTWSSLGPSAQTFRGCEEFRG